MGSVSLVVVLVFLVLGACSMVVQSCDRRDRVGGRGGFGGVGIFFSTTCCFWISMLSSRSARFGTHPNDCAHTS